MPSNTGIDFSEPNQGYCDGCLSTIETFHLQWLRYVSKESVEGDEIDQKAAGSAPPAITYNDEVEDMVVRSRTLYAPADIVFLADASRLRASMLPQSVSVISLPRAPQNDMCKSKAYREEGLSDQVTEVCQVRGYFLGFVPTTREIWDLYRDMYRTNRESVTMYQSMIGSEPIKRKIVAQFLAKDLSAKMLVGRKVPILPRPQLQLCSERLTVDDWHIAGGM
eukprot:SAG31_NODE_870_length_11338_cov_14.525047_1_plen_222_part_00